jgi:dinuclear metal center YbgI/SA1388 family protein
VNYVGELLTIDFFQQSRDASDEYMKKVIIDTKAFSEYLDNVLNINAFKSDHSNNGLQLEACDKIVKAVFAVDASLSTFEAAANSGASMLIVHHGLSWGGDPKRFTGLTARRMQYLFANKISLYAVHLPLDAHPVLGHNASIAGTIGLNKRRMFFEYDGVNIGVAGELQRTQTVKGLCVILSQISPKIAVYGETNSVKKVGIVSGGGGHDAIIAAAELGMDCLITGEVTHSAYSFAQESGIAVIALGHYKSEVPGLVALMNKVKFDLGLKCEFIDNDTGL